MADLKRVKNINQRNKDIVYGYMKIIQSMFPEDNSYFTIHQLIQDLCLLYFTILIKSEILNDDEKTTLYQMVNNHTNNKYMDEWKLIFRASRDGYRRTDFYEKYNDEINTICIISTPQNNVFGGFTKLKWSESKNGHEDDPSAFIYLLRSNKGYKPEIYPVQNNGRDAIQHYLGGYLSFGNCGNAFFSDGYQIFTTFSFGKIADSTQYNLKAKTLNGEYKKVKPTDIELFQI